MLNVVGKGVMMRAGGWNWNWNWNWKFRIKNITELRNGYTEFTEYILFEWKRL